MTAKGLAPHTIRKGYARLRAALDQAVSDGLIARNPIIVGKVKAPRIQPMEETIHALTHGQVRTLLATVQGHRQYALYAFAVRTGMREGELLGLRWIDIRWDTCELHITATLRYHRKTETEPSALIRTTPKSPSSRRVIPIGSWLLGVLRAHEANQQEERALQTSKGRWKESGLVFVSTVGSPINVSNLTSQFDALLKRAELPDITFHGLRHTFASLALADGEPLPDVSAILGHADPSITARIYAHSSREGKRRTMERLEAREQQREELGR